FFWLGSFAHIGTFGEIKIASVHFCNFEPTKADFGTYRSPFLFIYFIMSEINISHSRSFFHSYIFGRFWQWRFDFLINDHSHSGKHQQAKYPTYNRKFENIRWFRSFGNFLLGKSFHFGCPNSTGNFLLCGFIPEFAKCFLRMYIKKCRASQLPQNKQHYRIAVFRIFQLIILVSSLFYFTDYKKHNFSFFSSISLFVFISLKVQTTRYIPLHKSSRDLLFPPMEQGIAFAVLY